MKRTIVALLLFVASAAHADWPIRVDGLSTATGETNFAYDPSQECFYLDIDQDGTHDFTATEQCVDGTAGDSSGVPYDGRQNWCSPIAYEENGTTTTEGIQECIDYLGALGGGTVLLGPRGYFPTGGIVIDEGTGEIRIQGAGIGATFIQCLSGSCSANVALSVLDNDVTLSDFSMIHTVGTRTAAIQVGDVSNYVSGVTLRRLKIDGASGEAAGSRAGAGVLVTSLENRLDDVQVRWMADGVLFNATTSGGANANTLIGLDVSSSDNCVDTGVGNDVANEGDSSMITIIGIRCQTINGAAIVLRGGSANPTNYNSAEIIGGHFESTTVAVSIIGESSAYDPNVKISGSVFAVTTSAVTTEADANSNVIVENSWLDSNDCITHNGTGILMYRSLYGSSAPCVPTISSTVTDQTLKSHSFFLPAITTASDYMLFKADAALSVSELDCVASDGSGLTTVDVTINECSSAAASCSTTGLTATMTAVDTNVNDATTSNATIDADDWIEVATGTVTWTTPGTVQCTLQYRYDAR